MIPQTNLNGTERVAQMAAPEAPALEPVAREAASATPHQLTETERQGLAMSWVSIGLGMFLLFSGLALWAAWTFSAGFGGWLLGVAVTGLVILAIIVAINYLVLRAQR